MNRIVVLSKRKEIGDHPLIALIEEIFPECEVRLYPCEDREEATPDLAANTGTALPAAGRIDGPDV